MSLGGSGFTACIPQYANVDSFNSFLSKTTSDVSTNYFYWTSRIIATLVDANYKKAILNDERYQKVIGLWTDAKGQVAKELEETQRLKIINEI